MVQVKTIKKLIEVSLPLDDINTAAAKEKSIRFGHPSTLHLWWARRPLAAARAVIFAQMVNDPGGNRGYGPGKTKAQVKLERERLFDIIRKLVLWENTNNESVLEEARSEIRKSWRETCELNKNHPQAAELFDPDVLPGFHDPFAGGGALPLEGQRLGLESHASDLNPVSVLINRAMIDIPARFKDKAPVGPVPTGSTSGRTVIWSGSQGLAEDVRRYGTWLREEAFRRIGHLYPTVDLPVEYGSKKATIICWLWARTVRSPNPAFSDIEVPLVSSYMLSSKVGNEAYVEPVVENSSYRFVVRQGKTPEHLETGTKAIGRGSNFICILSGAPISGDYIKAEGQAGRIGTKLMAIVADGGTAGRVFLTPTSEMEKVVTYATPTWRPSGEVPSRLTGGTCVPYGLSEWGHLFTPRQLVALTTYADLIDEVKEKIIADAIAAGWKDDGVGIEDGGINATAYGHGVVVYLGLALSRLTDICNALCRWETSKTQVRNLFGRQSIPMLWDFAENNVFGGAAGDYIVSLSNLVRALETTPCLAGGDVVQADAQTQSISKNKVISTDPPYYDNIAYADLSDFFYVWLRRALRPVFPSLFATIAVPKAEELVATAYRHGGKQEAEKFFLDGMTEAMRRLAEQAHEAFPTTIYYAFKQSDTTDVGTGNTGWETFLEAVLRAGFAISGTWPMRTELANRMIGSGTNALASSIVLVCQKRDANAPTISRREFMRELKDELAEAVEEMIGGTDGISPVAPVDLAQAVIGPGMAIFSKYSAVLESDGSPMSVHGALTLINRMLTEGGDDFDPDTQFCMGWFDQYGWSVGAFGEATVLAQAKATSVDGVEEAGVVESGGGKVRLLKHAEYPEDWSPENDARTPIWEALHQMIRAHRAGGDVVAGGLLARMHERAEPIRQLAYRLYTLCERKGWAEDARAYNELITAWQHIESASHTAGHVGSQAKLDI